jgi:hypothetical protein
MSGLRYTFAHAAEQKPLPFVHMLVGGVHIKNGGEGDSDPAFAIGAGFEQILKKAGPDGPAIRAQVDYIVRPGDVNLRFSVGLAWKWSKH